MLPISSYVPITFIAVVMITLGFFYQASRKSSIALGVLFIWAFIQGIIGYTGFYTVTNTIPPRFVFLILPPITLILILFLTKGGKRFIDQLDLKWLTLIHIVRLPVEIVLYWLFLAKAIPEIMTFEGRNFDIIMGISSPIVFYFSFVKRRLNSVGLLVWNIVGVLLVLNVAITGVLSTPVSFQQFAFEQPNIAVLHFPFNLLPSLVVPLVLFSHFVSIRQIIQANIVKQKNDNANVVIFPPLLFFIATLLAVATSLIFPIFSIPLIIRQIGFALILVGFVILVVAVRNLNKHKTTVHPDGVTTAIVSNGIFKYSRNPIYLSFTLIYLGIVLLANAVAGLVLLVPILLITQKGIIEREEKYLSKKFGVEYEEYKSSVNRWL